MAELAELRYAAATMALGIANPSPWLPPDSVRMNVSIPTRRPSTSTSGPPLLPGLMGASVWM